MIRVLTLLAATFALFAVAPATASSPAAPVSAENGLAMKGYDPVAFFTLGKPQEGNAYHTFSYEGAIWRFASAQSLAEFQKSPARYAPQFGGYCASAVSQHYLAPGDPKFWKIVDGKLYLNANARAKALWEADQDEAIRRGHANWPAVLSNNQDASR